MIEPTMPKKINSIVNNCLISFGVAPIDFNKPGNQKVEIAVYVNGPENDPVYVTYEVSIATDLVVEAFDKVIYTQETLYTRDLFRRD